MFGLHNSIRSREVVRAQERVEQVPEVAIIVDTVDPVFVDRVRVELGEELLRTTGIYRITSIPTKKK